MDPPEPLTTLRPPAPPPAPPPASAPLDPAIPLCRLHPLTPVIEIPRRIGSFLIPLVILLVAKGDDPTALFWWGGVAAVLSVLAPTHRWLSLRYGLGDDQFIIRRGLLSRHVRSIPLEHVQNVDLERSLLHRLLGVAELRLETAGGAGAEASLAVVSMREAERLRAEVMALKHDRARDPERDGDLSLAHEPVVETPVHTASTADLLLAGATENRIGLIIGGLFGLLEFFDVDEDRAQEAVEEFVDQHASGIGESEALVVGLGVVALVLVGWVVSIVLTAVTYHGFALRRAGEDLRRRHGLLTRFEGVVPRKRVQVMHLEANPLRRWLGRVTIGAETAGSGQDRKSRGKAVLAPLLRVEAVGGLCSAVFGTLELDTVALSPVHRLALRRGFLRFALLGGLALSALALAVDERFWWGLPAWIPLAAILAHYRYKALGWVLHDGFLVSRAGLWTRRTWIVPVARVQTVALRQSPFQRRLGLATLTVDTAGSHAWSRARVIDLAEAEARGLLETLAWNSHVTGPVLGGV